MNWIKSKLVLVGGGAALQTCTVGWYLPVLAGVNVAGSYLRLGSVLTLTVAVIHHLHSFIHNLHTGN